MSFFGALEPAHLLVEPLALRSELSEEELEGPAPKPNPGPEPQTARPRVAGAVQIIAENRVLTLSHEGSWRDS